MRGGRPLGGPQPYCAGVRRRPFCGTQWLFGVQSCGLIAEWLWMRGRYWGTRLWLRRVAMEWISALKVMRRGFFLLAPLGASKGFKDAKSVAGPLTHCLCGG